jgi:hypothetical protein
MTTLPGMQIPIGALFTTVEPPRTMTDAFNASPIEHSLQFA